MPHFLFLPFLKRLPWAEPTEICFRLCCVLDFYLVTCVTHFDNEGEDIDVKRVTMQDIATEAGVSRTTVSFILNDTPHTNISEATRNRVLDVAKKLGYVRSTKQKPRTISFLVRRPTEEFAQAAFLIEVVRGMSSVVEPHYYQVSLFEAMPGTPFDFVNHLDRFHIAGIALFHVISSDAQQLNALQAREVPVIAVGHSNVPGIPSVGIDNMNAAFAAVQHLIELGHTRIGIINYAGIDHLMSAHRLMGYRRAMLAAGLAYDETLVFDANFTSESGYKAMQQLLPLEPDAVFVSGDVVAVGAIEAVRDHGLRVPDDISIVGFDDLPLVKHLTPPLTTIRRPAFEIGRLAGERLLDAIRGESQIQSILLESELVVRESTAPRHHHQNGRK